MSIRASDKMGEHKGEWYDGDSCNEENNKPAPVEETKKPASPMDTTAEAITQ